MRSGWAGTRTTRRHRSAAQRGEPRPRLNRPRQAWRIPLSPTADRPRDALSSLQDEDRVPAVRLVVVDAVGVQPDALLLTGRRIPHQARDPQHPAERSARIGGEGHLEDGLTAVEVLADRS